MPNNYIYVRIKQREKICLFDMDRDEERGKI